MSADRIIYYPIQFAVNHPTSPIVITHTLPTHLDKIVGIKAVHSVGIEKMERYRYMPIVGYLHIEFNNRIYQVGNIPVELDARRESNDGYVDVHFDVMKNAIMTGVYENKVMNGVVYATPDNQPTRDWKHYLVTIYLKCITDDKY